MGELASLPNIGKDTEEKLSRVGITTAAQLREIGSKKAWLMIRSTTLPVFTGYTDSKERFWA